VLERELRRVDSDHDQPVVSVGLRPTDLGLLAQPVDARQRPEVHDDDVAAQLGRAEWLGVEPLGRPAERGHVQTFAHGHLACGCVTPAIGRARRLEAVDLDDSFGEGVRCFLRHVVADG
jgi:hypothetical protein